VAWNASIAAPKHGSTGAAPDKEHTIRLTQSVWEASASSREHLNQLKAKLDTQRAGERLRVGGTDFPSLLVGVSRVTPNERVVDDVIATLNRHLHLLLADGDAVQRGAEKSVHFQLNRLKVVVFDEFNFSSERTAPDSLTNPRAIRTPPIPPVVVRSDGAFMGLLTKNVRLANALTDQVVVDWLAQVCEG
jgi:hypothetical protein